MEFKDIKNLSKTELKKKYTAMRTELFNARMKNSLGQLSNPLEIRRMRRDVARVMTAMNMATK